MDVRTITLAGIEGLDQNATYRARDGTRWSCAKLAREALRARVGNQSLSCSTEQEASATVLVATCTTEGGHDLAHAWLRMAGPAPVMMICSGMGPRWPPQSNKGSGYGAGRWWGEKRVADGGS